MSFPNPSPPSISLTPSSALESRSRAGTLLTSPGHQAAPNGVSIMPNGHSSSGYVGSTHGSSQVNSVPGQLAMFSTYPYGTSPYVRSSFSSSTSPLIAAHDSSLVLPPLDDDFDQITRSHSNAGLVSAQLHQHSAAHSAHQGRRLRSSSLFSTNSIWNDDTLSVPSPSQQPLSTDLSLSLGANESSSSFLSPILASHQDHPQPTRNRSYTTTATNTNQPYGYASNHQGGQQRMSPSPFLSAAHSDMNFLLENLVDQPLRQRSQTYSGVLPEVPLQQQNFSISQSQHQFQPALLDEFDYSHWTITTNFENPNLGPTHLLLFDNLPQFMDSVKLYSILNNALGSNRALGTITAVKVTLSLSKLALVDCLSIEIAMALKASFNHLELVPGVILYVAFATVEPKPAPVPEKRRPISKEEVTHTDLLSIRENLINTVSLLSHTHIDINKVVFLINKSLAYGNDNYQDNFGPLPDPIPLRQFDSPKLRELRKVLDYNEAVVSGGPVPDGSDEELKIMSQLDLEELCLAMLDELPELCYDYLGNTIVQKLFSLLHSPLIKLMMVKEIAPYLTQLSIHKNGTWAIQKVVNLCSVERGTIQQKYLIGASLKPYTVKLFNDQFGNYVLQGCVKFGSPFNDFIFESMLDNFLAISFGRFGARCIRTILETSHDKHNPAISNEQVLLVAGLIIQFAEELVVNNNGSLLITWFLDTFTGFGAMDDRFELLTNKLIGNLKLFCTHKLANLTILKILNNRSDVRSKRLIMDAIFGRFDPHEFNDDENTIIPSRMLEAILSENHDHGAGPVFIYKIVSNPLLLVHDDDSSKYQRFVILQIKRVLLEIPISKLQPYKKLLDEVSLSGTRLNRSSSMNSRRRRNFPLKTKPKSGPNPQDYYNYGGYNQFQPATPSNMIAYSEQTRFVPQQQQQLQQDMLVMQQLEQLSLSSAALGYSNPGTPGPRNENGYFQ